MRLLESTRGNCKIAPYEGAFVKRPAKNRRYHAGRPRPVIAWKPLRYVHDAQSPHVFGIDGKDAVNALRWRIAESQVCEANEVSIRTIGLEKKTSSMKAKFNPE